MLKWFLMRFAFLFGSFFFVLHAIAEDENSLLKVKMYKSPRRDVSIIVTPEGYYPEHISVFQGEKVKFYVTSTIDDPGCFLVSGHDIYLSAGKGNLTEGEVHFTEPGHFNYYCPSMQSKGTITVIKKRNPNREIASKKVEKKKEWVPRD